MSQKKSRQSVKARREAYQAQKQRQRIMMTGGLVAGLLLVAAFIFFAQRGQQVLPDDVVLPESLTAPASADGRAWGPVDAPVVIQEYSDFQCPHCREFAANIGSQLSEVYGDTGLVRFEYNDLAFLGSESTRAAEAARCANEQGKFWQYHDTLFANQNGRDIGAFRDQALQAFATAIGLDEDAFNECLDSNRYRQAVTADAAAASQQGINSTPTVYINGELLSGVPTFEQLQQVIASELAQGDS